MATTAATTSDAPRAGNALLGTAPPSPAGPVPDGSRAHVPPPAIPGPGIAQVLRFSRRPLPFLFGARRRHGETFAFRVPGRPRPLVVTTHPDHARSLFTAPPELVPSMTADSPLRPIVGESVLTANGRRHLRQRRLLLPPFHGDAIARYAATIEELIEREVASWPVGTPFPIARRMQAVTLDVIMAGVFGVEGRLPKGSTERRLRDTTRRLLALSEHPAFVLLELRNLGRLEATGILKRLLDLMDVHFLQLIRERRAAPGSGSGDGRDVLSLLLEATDEDGVALTDEEIRDELVTLVLAGHETTANTLAWAFERLTRTPAAHATLCDLVRRDDPAADAYVEATVHETMRVRPVIPMVGRVVRSDWAFGEHVVPAGTPVAIGIVLIHHREDLYPQPHAFLPERFVGAKPGTYTWLPFGGGTRRCLGAALALAEERIVLKAIARHVDLVAPRPEAEREHHRNVTIIPSRGGEVVVRRQVG